MKDDYLWDPSSAPDPEVERLERMLGRLRSKAPAPDVKGPWYSLDHHFVIEPGEARLPKPPITGKTTGPRPEQAVLERTGH